MKVYKVKVNGKVYEVELEAVSENDEKIVASEKETESAPAPSGDKEILAPIAGKVVDVKVNVGDKVSKGQTVAIIDAMKLETEIQSQFDGKVVDVKVNKGSNVNNKDVLIVLG